jgi:nucleoside-diphosphate-sugar epimerase
VTGTVIIGAGLVATSLVRLLVAQGEQVTVATRSGTSLPGADSVIADAADMASLSAATKGATTIFLCTNPPYFAWPKQWPPIFRAVIAAALASGADLVAMGNLYPYGRAAMPMTERSPETTTETKGLIRKAGWDAMRAANDRGDLRAVEVRASDYFGPGATYTAHLGDRFFRPVLSGKRVGVLGDPESAHSWAYLPDIASTLVAASRYKGEWGRIWHVPSSSELSRVHIASQVNPQARVFGYPQLLVRTLGLVDPTMREVYASSYQFTAPFVSSAIETEQKLGVRATDWNEALAATVASYRRD